MAEPIQQRRGQLLIAKDLHPHIPHPFPWV
jgi:hypothetical protein